MQEEEDSNLISRRENISSRNESEFYTEIRKQTQWVTKRENSIFFECDGPYKAMILPASTDEGRMLKKRYCVFEYDGSIAELKGFEMKRRGELRLTQVFQEEIFEQGHFLKGKSRQEVYDGLGKVANRWLDVLDSKGRSLTDEDVFHLVSEHKSMSKSVEDSGSAKSTAATCARRLAKILGNQILKDSGLSCHLIIANSPPGASTTERAIPVKIFSCEESIKQSYLKEWLNNKSLSGDDFDMRNIIDWDYYKERLNNSIQKILSIPAIMQKYPNPVPRCEIPEWLVKREKEWAGEFKQMKLGAYMFTDAKGEASLLGKQIGTSGSTDKKAILNRPTPLKRQRDGSSAMPDIMEEDDTDLDEYLHKKAKNEIVTRRQRQKDIQLSTIQEHEAMGDIHDDMENNINVNNINVNNNIINGINNDDSINVNKDIINNNNMNNNIEERENKDNINNNINISIYNDTDFNNSNMDEVSLDQMKKKNWLDSMLDKCANTDKKTNLKKTLLIKKKMKKDATVRLQKRLQRRIVTGDERLRANMIGDINDEENQLKLQRLKHIWQLVAVEDHDMREGGELKTGDEVWCSRNENSAGNINITTQENINGAAAVSSHQQNQQIEIDQQQTDFNAIQSMEPSLEFEKAVINAIHRKDAMVTVQFLNDKEVQKIPMGWITSILIIFVSFI